MRRSQGVGVGALALVGLLSVAPAGADPLVVTRMVVPGGSATSTKIVPGGAATFEVRIDAPTVSTVGTAYRLTQTSPPANGFFSITARSTAGSPFNDVDSGETDAAVTTGPGNLLDPDSEVNLGKSSVNFAGVAAGNNIFVTAITLGSSVATPIGSYVIQPTAVASNVTEVTSNPLGNDVSMSAASFTIVVGATLSVTRNGTGTVVADSGLINCGAVCSDIYPGTVVNLSQTPGAGFAFTGWGGACTGTGACQVTVNAAKNVIANFTALIPTVTNTATIRPPVGKLNTGASCTSSGGIVRSFDPATGICSSSDTDNLTPGAP